MEEAKLIYRLLSEKKGHFYVCGDSGMAEDVGQTLLLLVQKTGEMNRQESETFVAFLRVYAQFLLQNDLLKLNIFIFNSFFFLLNIF